MESSGTEKWKQTWETHGEVEVCVELVQVERVSEDGGLQGRGEHERGSFSSALWLFLLLRLGLLHRSQWLQPGTDDILHPWYSVQASALLMEQLRRADAGSLNHLKTHSLSHTMVDAGCQLGLLAGMPACSLNFLIIWWLSSRREIQAESSLPFMEVRPSAPFCLLRQS